LLDEGNKEEAVKTVGFTLMELVQNFAKQSKLVESGKHALNILEFFQLTQLQTVCQDALVVSLPLPFLDRAISLSKIIGFSVKIIAKAVLRG
jgi:hypothetical protein